MFHKYSFKTVFYSVENFRLFSSHPLHERKREEKLKLPFFFSNVGVERVIVIQLFQITSGKSGKKKSKKSRWFEGGVLSKVL